MTNILPKIAHDTQDHASQTGQRMGHEDTRSAAHASQPGRWNDRRVEDRRDDGSSSTGYALSDDTLTELHCFLTRAHGKAGSYAMDGIHDRKRYETARDLMNDIRAVADKVFALIGKEEPKHHFWLGASLENNQD